MRKIFHQLGLTVAFIPCIALATNQPLDVVNDWAKAAKERNGKKQYQLLCAEQQNKNRASLQATNWVTGVSSPGIGSYKISPLSKKQDTSAFTIKYQVVLQEKPFGSVTDQIYVKDGCITKFKYLSPAAVDPDSTQ